MANRYILVVEDESTLARILGDTLRSAGYDVAIASNGIEGLELFKARCPDLIIADIMMPEMDGLTMVEKIRTESNNTEVLFLSARSGAEDVIAGFHSGGNDYMRKPFSLDELLARVAALLARHPMDRSKHISIGEYRLDVERWTLNRSGVTRRLTARESAVLAMLANNIGEIVSSEGLLRDIWGDDSYYNLRSLNVFVSRLRGYLSDDPHIEIQSIRGVGYRLLINR